MILVQIFKAQVSMVTYTKNVFHGSPLHAAAPSPQHSPPRPLSPPDLRVSHPTLSTHSVYKVMVGRQMLLKAAAIIRWAYAPLLETQCCQSTA